jgi:Ca2+-binding RTX toxin-like protein
MANLRGTEKGDRFGIYDGPTDAADTIYALGGDDVIYGLGGNDHIIGGAGADFIFGGSGMDTAYYNDSWEGVFIDLTASSGRGGTAEGDLLISIEAVYGSRFNDNLIGNEEDNYLWGDDGADYLYGLDGSDYFQGGLGADTLIGGDDAHFDFADYSDSPEGVIVNLWTHAGSYGTAAGDRLYGIEALFGSTHTDTLLGDDGDNLIFAGYGNDLVFGLQGFDDLYGEAGNDTLEGGAGGDFLHGATGIDTASYAQATARVTASLIHPGLNTGDAAGDVYLSIENLAGTAFNDTLEGDDEDNLITALDGLDVLDGFGGNDILIGGNARDVLLGGSGGDFLSGGDGDDVLIGGLNTSIDPATGMTLFGIDYLEGGTGADMFSWYSTAESSGAGYDIITDFNPAEGDRLDLAWIDADETTAAHDAFTFVGDIGGANPGRGQISYIYLSGTWVLFVNNDADKDPDMTIHVDGSGLSSTPTASWFIL